MRVNGSHCDLSCRSLCKEAEQEKTTKNKNPRINAINYLHDYYVELVQSPLLKYNHSIASFTIETGRQKCHVMWISTNQQGAW